MQNSTKLLAFSGSIRKDSFNSRLLKIAASKAEQANAKVTVIDLADYLLPIYNGDLEHTEGLPESCLALKQLMHTHQGFLIACPEYNGSITPLLKNTLDWISRPSAEEQVLQCFKGKVVGLLSASPGQLGGMRGLVHVREILKNLGCLVIPEQVSIAKAITAFDTENKLVDQTQMERVQQLSQKVVEITTKLN